MDRPGMGKPRLTLISSVSLIPLVFSLGVQAQSEEHVRDLALKLLGKHIFYDTELSNPKGGQACVSCHEPFAGGTSGFSDINETIVAVPGANFEVTNDAIGGRKPQTNAYASFSFPWSESCGTLITPFCGGNFWDGRAQGKPSDLADGSNPSPHLDVEIFHDIENPKVIAFGKYFGPTSDQALNPMPSIVEQNIAEIDVCKRVAASEYRNLYKAAFGKSINCSTNVAISDSSVVYPHYEISFRRMMLAVGAYQHSWDINSFSSKRDFALRSELACIEDGHAEYYDSDFCAEVTYEVIHNEKKSAPGKFPLLLLTEEENFGHDMFYTAGGSFGPPPSIPTVGPGAGGTEIPAAQCSFCHADKPPIIFGPAPFQRDDGSELLQVYADQAYHNIGVPANPEIANFGDIDGGLSKSHLLGVPGGGFRSPTMRNLTKGASENFTKAYMHNGFFKSLERIIHFYNTRDILPPCPLPVAPELLTDKYAEEHNCWPAPEFAPALTAGFLIGDLGLSPEEETALVAYLKTLDDYHTAESPYIFERRAYMPAQVAIRGNYRPRPAKSAAALFGYEGEWLIRECNKHYLGDGIAPISVAAGYGCNKQTIINILRYLD